MRKILLTLLGVVAIVGAAYAAVELKQDGTLLGKVETINVTGAAVTVTNKDAVVNAGSNNSNLFVDGSIYLTGANGNAGVLWMTQQDGGCSRCEVAANGSSFSCADQTCPSGM